MKLHLILRSAVLLLLILSSATATSQTFTFDVQHSVNAATTYRVSVNTSSRHIEVSSYGRSVFSQSYAQARVLSGGVAFSFYQGRTPSLTSSRTDWFFAIKPTAIGFNNKDIKDSFVMAVPTNSSSYTSTYSSLVAAVNGTASNNVSNNNNVSSSGSNRTYTANGVSFTMIYVSGGTFTMGATSEQGSDADSDESPTHQVTLSSYSIGQTEVTQELWQAVMGSNPSYFKGSKRPVESVSWNDCQDFIRRLNSLTGQNFRLPTEAEWEYAARGGRSGGTKYAGSNSIDDVAWYWKNSGDKYLSGTDSDWDLDKIQKNNGRTHDVATKRSNGLGIYDMSGNVWEWCQDWKGNYSSSSQTNPQGPSTGSYRVNRGGSWGHDARCCRVSIRYSNDPDRRYVGIGLRLAL